MTELLKEHDKFIDIYDDHAEIFPIPDYYHEQLQYAREHPTRGKNPMLEAMEQATLETIGEYFEYDEVNDCYFIPNYNGLPTAGSPTSVPMIRAEDLELSPLEFAPPFDGLPVVVPIDWGNYTPAYEDGTDTKSIAIQNLRNLCSTALSNIPFPGKFGHLTDFKDFQKLTFAYRGINYELLVVGDHPEELYITRGVNEVHLKATPTEPLMVNSALLARLRQGCRKNS